MLAGGAMGKLGGREKGRALACPNWSLLLWRNQGQAHPSDWLETPSWLFLVGPVRWKPENLNSAPRTHLAEGGS